MKKHRIPLLIGILAIAGAGLSAFFMGAFSGHAEEPDFTFEIAATEASRVQGLSGRADIPAGYGMLFVFDEPAYYGFWMKDMLASIDIIWLADDGTILDIDAEVAPETFPAAYYPPQPVRYVLETRAGEARARGWEAGSRIRLPKEAR